MKKSPFNITFIYICTPRQCHVTRFQSHGSTGNDFEAIDEKNCFSELFTSMPIDLVACCSNPNRKASFSPHKRSVSFVRHWQTKEVYRWASPRKAKGKHGDRQRTNSSVWVLIEGLLSRIPSRKSEWISFFLRERPEWEIDDSFGRFLYEILRVWMKLSRQPVMQLFNLTVRERRLLEGPIHSAPYWLPRKRDRCWLQMAKIIILHTVANIHQLQDACKWLKIVSVD